MGMNSWQRVYVHTHTHIHTRNNQRMYRHTCTCFLARKCALRGCRSIPGAMNTPSTQILVSKADSMGRRGKYMMILELSILYQKVKKYTKGEEETWQTPT